MVFPSEDVVWKSVKLLLIRILVTAKQCNKEKYRDLFRRERNKIVKKIFWERIRQRNKQPR